MSVPIIGELFQQIFQSEEQIKKRFEAIKQVNQEIQEHQDKIRQLKYESEAFQGNLKLLHQKLIQEQIEEKWLGARENILKEQKEKSTNENIMLEKEIMSIEKIEDTERKKFLDDCDVFLKEYNMSDQNCDLFNFETCMKEENKELVQQQKELKQKVQEFVCKREERDVVTREKESILENINKMSVRKRGLFKQLNQIKLERENMIANKEKVVKRTESNVEYTSLLSEVDRSRKEQIILQEDHQKLASELYKHQQSFMKAEHRRKQYASQKPQQVYHAKQQQQQQQQQQAFVGQHEHNESFELEGNPWKASTSRKNTNTSNRGRKLFNYSGIKKRREEKLKIEMEPNDFFVNAESLPLDSFEFFGDEEILMEDVKK